MKKIIAIVLSVSICLGLCMKIQATTDFIFTVDKEVAKVGYTDIYHEDPSKEPGKVKPVTPPDQELTIHINSSSLVGSNYKLYIADKVGNAVTNEVIGILNFQDISIKLILPGTLSGGKYRVMVEVGSIKKEKEIKVFENVALRSTPSTNARADGGEVIGNIIDGNYMNWVSNDTNVPTGKKPYEFVLDYGSDIINLSTMQIYTNYGNKQGIKRVEVLYYDLTDRQWKNTMNKDGNIETMIVWPDPEGDRLAYEISFDKEYETNKLKLKVLESYVSWGKCSVISEIQTWGYKTGESYDISQVEKSGKQGIENITNISLGYKNYTGVVNFELVNADDLSSLKPNVQYNVDMKNGQLEYAFIIPGDIPVGTYKIVAKINGNSDSTLEYNIVINDEKKYVNVSQDMLVSTDIETIEGVVENILDGNKDTYWTGELGANNVIKIQTKDINKINIVNRKMKIYAKDNIVNVKVEARTNSTDKKMGNLGTYIPTRKTDEKGDYFELDLGTLTASFEYSLTFTGASSTITIEDIEITGLLLSENLMSKAKIYKNGTLLSVSELSDNDISTSLICNDNAPVEFVFDFSPYKITTDMLLYVSNYPKSQGINTTDMEYFDGNQWVSLSKYTLEYETSDETREVKVLPFQKVETTKIRMLVTDANKTWGHFIFTELYALGDVSITAEDVANSVGKINMPIMGQKKLEMPALLEEFKNDFVVTIANTSDVKIINLEGDITAPDEDTEIYVVFKVSSKKRSTAETGYTKSIRVMVPKKIAKGNKLITFEPNNRDIIKNPSMGWVQYIEGFECRLHDRTEDKSDLCTVDPSNVEEYWRQMDVLYAEGLATTILYIRMPWSWFEPTEGKYAWNDPGSELSQLLEGAKKRNLELAFRVLLNSSSAKDQVTPEWFFAIPGTQFWNNTAYQVDNSKKEAYLDDPVFIEKFGDFIDAFGERFNDEKNNVSFIDGMGYGTWGETENGYRVLNGNSEQAANEILKMYDKAFPDVLLGAQYAGLGHKNAIDNYGYIIRRDAFGSGYLSSEQKQGIKEYFDKGVPVYAENCYHHFESMKNNWGNSTIEANRNKTLTKVIDDALELHANTLDVRVLEDCKLWLENDKKNGDNLIEKFGLNGGYRITPVAMQVPKQGMINQDITVEHVWQNNGVGILPNRNVRWNNKYKVAFALLDAKTNKVIYQFNESSEKVNPGDWLKQKGSQQYTSSFKLPDSIKPGSYKFATAIVNEKLEYIPEINLAIEGGEITQDGWYIMETMDISHDKYTVTIDDIQNGKIIANKSRVEKYQDLELTFIPDNGYSVNQALVNEQVVQLTNNKYIIKRVTTNIHVVATFKKDELITIAPEEIKNGNSIGASIISSNTISTGDFSKGVLMFIITLGSLSLLLGIKRQAVSTKKNKN